MGGQVFVLLVILKMPRYLCFDCKKTTQAQPQNLSKTNREMVEKHDIYLCRKCRTKIILKEMMKRVRLQESYNKD